MEMDQNILNRAAFLIERADVPRSVPPQNPEKAPLDSISGVMLEQQLLAAFMAGILLGSSAYTLKFSWR